MKIFRRFNNKIKYFIANSIANSTIKNLGPELSFIENCEKRIKYIENQNGAQSIICHDERSPLRGDIKIEDEIFEKGYSLIIEYAIKNLNIEDMELKIFDLIRLGPKYQINQRRIRKEIKKSFRGLRQNNSIPENKSTIIPNNDLWNELKNYAARKWGITKIGFTKIPERLIFKNKFILYPYALIFM
ncbi:MAG: hypothetical protein ACTSRP_03690 [Candidatus Helarchaeota archaeon]